VLNLSGAIKKNSDCQGYRLNTCPCRDFYFTFTGQKRTIDATIMATISACRCLLMTLPSSGTYAALEYG
jgi:hypothetical protein